MWPNVISCVAEKALRRSAASEPCLFNEDGSTYSEISAVSLNEWGADAGELDSDPFEAAIDELHEKRCGCWIQLYPDRRLGFMMARTSRMGPHKGN